MKTDLKKLVPSLALPLAAGGLSALISSGEMLAFELLNKPPLSPPPQVFPIVWTALYLMMGYASYRVWTSDAEAPLRRRAALWYLLSLAFNFGWPIIFFNTCRYLAAFVWLCLMFVFTLLAASAFRRADKTAGALMLPYLLWTAFAGYLNLGIYLLN